jgi:hypothetical protein
MLRTAALAAGLVLIAGVSQSQPTSPFSPTPPAMLPVKQVMKHIVNPAAELYWKAGGEVDTAEGETKRAPTAQDDARWNAAVDAAAQLQEAGNLLAMPGRARDNDKWMKFAGDLNAAGAQAIKAAQSRDPKAVDDAGSALYNACFECHAKYIPRPANSLYKHFNEPDSDFKPPK